ncbi:nuclear transport factor 2 family protein [uncultured Stenotrophomonas sp.]|uniref:nuclear transport factor 2 family protein n=1 Tax=uncultured Stenotrophomonas sp. TaxID=165438 RepID=UPI0025E370F5|nr:nuclear transport factor 2 family protein [uncultured Stenotrophomonas sp.]
MNIKHLIFLLACSAGVTTNVLAGPALDAAQAHFAAIGAGDRAAILRDYADNARLTWVGGPLDGSYDGPAAIGAVWDKFAAAAGPARVNIVGAAESANPKGATVVAAVHFEGKAQVKVRYLLTYRDGKLVNETWQVDPKLAAGAY